MEIRSKVVQLLNELAQDEYSNIFPKGISDDERLQFLTSESLLALIFVTSVEDEFSIEFRDDEVDIGFFNSIDSLVARIEHYLN